MSEHNQLQPGDLKIDEWSNSQEYALRITHVPTGLSVTKNKSSSRLAARGEALKELAQLVFPPSLPPKKKQTCFAHYENAWGSVLHCKQEMGHEGEHE